MMLETREQLEELLKNGVSDIEAAAEIADKDPMRPRYHFHSPSQWMDDPNGIIYHKGYYHMMYSLNPNTSKHRAGMVYKTAHRVWTLGMRTGPAESRFGGMRAARTWCTGSICP